MKHILLVLWLSVVSVISQTWIVHNARDNSLAFGAYGTAFYVPGPGCAVGWFSDWRTSAYWDAGFDDAYPEYAYSGLYEEQFNGCGYSLISSALGYADSITIVNTNSVCTSVDGYLSQGYPDYNGGDVFYFPLTGGEFWIDFDSNGSVRISSSLPTDFGKWAWDGSINPSWVEPLLQRGKRLAKGHSK